MYKVKGGRRLADRFIPLRNYTGIQKFAAMAPDAMLEYAIHDTFDALSPRYDSPVSANYMLEVAKQYLDQPFEIIEMPTITLLRSKL